MDKMLLDDLDDTYDYVLVKDDIAYDINLLNFINNEINSYVYDISLDDYLANIGKINYSDYYSYVNKFNELYKQNKINNNSSIKKAFDYVTNNIKCLELFVKNNNDIIEIEGNNILEKILIILNNSKDNIKDENGYLMKYIYYLTNKVSEYERKLIKGEK